MFAGGRAADDRGGIVGLLARAVVAPLAASLIQMAISRSREYKADEGAARMTHQPEGLAAALEKLTAYAKRLPLPASGQTAHLFIVSPFSGRSLMSLFSTHPPSEERVARLRAMRSAGGRRGGAAARAQTCVVRKIAAPMCPIWSWSSSILSMWASSSFRIFSRISRVAKSATSPASLMAWL